MKDIMLIFCVLGMFTGVYFIMKKVDDFLIENYKMIEYEEEIKEPSFIVLTDELSKEEIMEEIQKFQDKHEYTKIIICDSSIIKDEIK